MNDYFQNLSDWLPLFLRGAKTTLILTFSSYALGIALGLLVAIARLARPGRWYWPVRALLRIYVEVFRGLPIIVTLFILFFGLPAIGVTVSNNPMIVGTIGLGVTLGAYLSEVFRAAILAIDPGQMEAGLAFGMSKTTAYVRVVLPQAFLVAIPTLGGYFISLLKDTSLVSFIGVTELFGTGTATVSLTFRAFQVYLTIGAMYLVLSLLAAWAISIIESRMRLRGAAYLGHERPPHNLEGLSSSGI